jgi:hypothetical protein
MASVMTIESGVFGNRAEETDVCVEIENRGAWLHLGGIIWNLFYRKNGSMPAPEVGDGARCRQSFGVV